MGHGRGYNLLHKWDMLESFICACGDVQSICHIIEICPTTKFISEIEKQHKGSPIGMGWLTNIEIILL